MLGEAGGNFIDASTIINYLDLKPGLRIADFGCGSSGYFLLPIAKIIGETGIIYGIDIVPSALESVKNLAVRNGLKNIRTVWSNLEIFGATKIEEGSLDRAYIINVLFQSKKDFEVLKEVARLVKMGGLILVVEWKEEVAQFGPPVNIRISKSELLRLAKLLNLDKKLEFEAGPYHYGVVFQKVV